MMVMVPRHLVVGTPPCSVMVMGSDAFLSYGGWFGNNHFGPCRTERGARGARLGGGRLSHPMMMGMISPP
jgi:hypothetical protein